MILHWASYLLLLGSLALVGCMAWSYKQDAVRAAEELDTVTQRLDTSNQRLWHNQVGLDADIALLWAAVFGSDGRRDDDTDVLAVTSNEDTAPSHPVDDFARQQWLLANPADYGRHAAPAPDAVD